ncbi:MAG: type II asparaginase [Parabacteroides sp.]|nr:type II asparaginase [Parabacteroides sp.]
MAVCLLLVCLAPAGSAYGLPRIRILATGGTIAGVGASSTGSAYKPGQLGVDQLLAAVPEIKEVAEVTGEQVFTIASQDMTVADWLQLARRVNELLARDDVDGIVLTHGTDTMEETAYFLNLTVKSDKPVVLTGAMRPATSLSADGPLNLFDAVVTAGAEESAGRGVLVVLNGTVSGARDVMKTHTLDVETFRSPNTGALGYVSDAKVHYRMDGEKLHTAHSVFDVTGLTELPRVGIVYGYAGAEPALVEALVQKGYAGIVHAGVGNGNIAADVFPALIQARNKGVQIVRSSRIPSGPSTLNAEVDDEANRFIAALDLSPQKARILLMLALTQTNDWKEIQRLFEEY